CLSAGRVMQSYIGRVDVAVAYYNPMTPAELAGIRWLHDRPGTAAVSAKGGDMVAGTLYAWRIEGLAHERALGTGQAFLAELDSAQRDSVDVDRLFSGTAGVEDGRMRVSASEAAVDPVQLGGVVGGDWFSLAELGLAPMPASAASPTVGVSKETDRAELSLDHGGLAVRASVLTASPTEVVVTLRRPAGSSEPLVVNLGPPESATSATLRADGHNASAELDVNGRAVTVSIAGDGAIARVDRDSRTGSARLHLEADPSTETMTLTMGVKGLDTVTPVLSTYHDVDLIQRHDIRYLFTWRQSALAPILAERGCFEPAAQNDEVVIFQVRDACRRPVSPPVGAQG
ncbi:MAG: hypothetical protein M3137_12150, partial [Actinomycetota bacterium]|nr:hypothetical protein [Actinomycetota bacterium]